MTDRVLELMVGKSRAAATGAIVCVCVAAGTALSSAFSWLFHGELLRSFVITGFLTSLCVSSLVAQVLTRLFRRLWLAERRARDANLAKSQFLATMSHEIRTPLNAITGMAYLIRRAGLGEEQARRLAQLEAAGDHLLQVINAVLDLSKIEAGKLTLEQRPLSPGTVLDQVSLMLADKAGAKGLKWRVENHLPPARLRGDATRLKQALLNYAANAVKFTEQGEVVLHAELLDEDDTHVLLRFEVQDTGVGIGPAALARLFNNFEQVDNSTDPTQGGSGLGLAITRRLAELMGGEAGATSVPGEGSRFWFTARLERVVPLGTVDAPGAASPVPGQATLDPAALGRRVLVVDDDALSLEIAGLMLREAGLHATTVATTQEALDLAARQRFDLVLMDLRMPRLGGLAATRSLRQLPGWHTVPILAFTANVLSQDRQACLDAGMSDFVFKPAKRRELIAAMNRWLAGPLGAHGSAAQATAAQPSDDRRVPSTV